MVENMIPFPRHFVDSVTSTGWQGCFHPQEDTLVFHKFDGACENDPDVRVMFTASLKNRKLSLRIDVKVREGFFHGVQMTGLTCQIEKVILLGNQLICGEGVARPEKFTVILSEIS